ncbi:MAG: hypothetical protein D3906_02070 [Candidatus Electrothrix sp. AUS1_2]|nr:hypothetical protein [Candidatus Electrothrix sp. AUS1_2]
MKKKMVITLMTGSCLLVGQNSFATDISFIPRASVGFSNYSVKWDIKTKWVGGKETSSNVFDIEDDLLTGGVGVTLAEGKFYFDASLEQTAEATEGSYEAWNAKLDTTYDISAYALTLGYNIIGGLSAFGGWNDHTTTIMKQYSASKLASEFSSGGWFLGLSYGWNVLEDSAISVKAAYAVLQGDIEGEEALENGTVTVRSDGGDATGATLGLAWKSYLTDSLSYSFTVDWYNYTYEDFSNDFSVHWNDAQGPLPISSDSASDVEEEAYIFRFALSYMF